MHYNYYHLNIILYDFLKVFKDHHSISSLPKPRTVNLYQLICSSPHQESSQVPSYLKTFIKKGF